MKECYTCKESKPYSDFNKNSRKKDGLNGRCRPCSVEAVRRSRAGETKKYRISTRVTIEERKEILRKLREVPCSDCQGSFPYYCMDFDHLPEFSKAFTIMQNYKNFTWDTILEEVAKCEVVCSNCHRIRTFTRRAI